MLLTACSFGGGSKQISSFEDCTAAGNPVAESYPRTCRGPDGKMYREEIGNILEKLDLIRPESPRPLDTVSLPLTFTGEARGTWYFEASFPVEIRDLQGNVLAQSHAEAQSDWMTTEFVPYKGTIDGSVGKGKVMLVLKKDNPSGLPEHEDELWMPVTIQ